MIKRKGVSQIENLTCDHKPLESKGQMGSDWGMLYTIGKIFLRAIRYFPCIYTWENDKYFLKRYKGDLKKTLDPM